MKVNQIVNFKPEYSEGDNQDYKIIEIRGNRSLIEPVNSKLTFKPQESVFNYMLKEK